MANVTARVRMYRLDKELGDCFLVTFTAGQQKSHMLIDCGSFQNSANSKTRLGQIARLIKKEVGKDKIDVVVGTHQHNDHLSGFLHAADDFEGKVGQVWLSWLDDPKDAAARRIGDDYNNLRLTLSKALRKMAAHPAAKVKGSRAMKSLDVLEDMMGFFGAKKTDKFPPEVPVKAMKVLRSLATGKPKYLEPADVVDMPGLPPNTVRVHVLGPPRNEKELFRKDPRKGESYDHKLAASMRMAGAFLRALDRRTARGAPEEREYPFAAHHKARRPSSGLRDIKKRYEEDRWRSIDDAWMEQAGSLALWLDDFTNNSSLVLAIELVDSGKVLLFAADAQAGNWATWKDIEWPAAHPGTASLLKRTVLYKVGHHASHNATLKASFEQMGGDDLCALIPVHKQDPNVKKKNGWKMPAKNLFKRLVEKTEGRVLQMDGVNPAECDPTAPKVKAAWKRAGVKPVIDDDYIQLEIR